MNAFSEFWNGLGRSARRGLAAGVVLILLLTALAAAWLLHEPYGVLFTGLGQNDMASMAAELERMKVPYRVGDDGALLVPEAAVGRTRLALVNRDVPLHGAVGFEVFNNEEFGASDFVQKINYQRALQGELTRTILSIDEVESVRVHLALPEQGLFRKERERAKASVTVVAKPGRALQPLQVQGIQRLVAASVPEVLAQDVTVLDQHGVPLSRQAATDGADPLAGAGAAGLDLKSSTERYLTQKAEAVLDRSFGKGQVVVSVDAVFVEQQTRVTTEEVLPAHGGGADAVPTGVVVRERQNSRDGEGATPANGAQVTTSETEYQVGKRTEQVTSPAGALRRLEVAVVVRHAMSDADIERVRDIVSASIGFNRERGDVVTVQAIAPQAEAASGVQATPAVAPAPAPVPRSHATDIPSRTTWLALALAAVLGLGALALVAARRGRGRPAAGARPLSGAEREQLLLSLQAWLAEPGSAHAPGAPR